MAFQVFKEKTCAIQTQVKRVLFTDTAPTGTLLSRENFKGCLRNVDIRNELKDWIDMDELQNVLLSECLAIS